MPDSDDRLAEIYLSATLRARLAFGPVVPPERRQLIGAIAFVDISGFSRMADKLASLHGARKAGELLQGITNDYLARLLDTTIVEHGGDVLKFAGDAFIVLWESAPELASRQRAADDACRCCLRLLALFDGYEVHLEGTFDTTLHLHAGVAVGELSEFFLGRSSADGGYGLEHLFAGPLIDRMGEAANAAAAGEVVLSSCTAALLEPSHLPALPARPHGALGTVGHEVEGGRWLLTPSVAARERPPPPRAAAAPKGAGVAIDGGSHALTVSDADDATAPFASAADTADAADAADGAAAAATDAADADAVDAAAATEADPPIVSGRRAPGVARVARSRSALPKRLSSALASPMARRPSASARPAHPARASAARAPAARAPLARPAGRPLAAAASANEGTVDGDAVGGADAPAANGAVGVVNGIVGSSSWARVAVEGWRDWIPVVLRTQVTGTRARAHSPRLASARPAATRRDLLQPAATCDGLPRGHPYAARLPVFTSPSGSLLPRDYR